MKRLFISSIILSSCLEAQEKLEYQNKDTQEESKTKTAIAQVVNGTKVSGFAFARHFSNFGDLGGNSQQYRLKLDVTTGELNGYSVTGGILFSQGSSTPTNTSSTHGAVQGSRGTAYNGNFSDRFGISNFYASKNIKTETISFDAKLGKMNIASPFSDKNLDLSTGFEANLKHNNINYFFHYSDSWMTDTLAYVFRRSNLKTSSGSSIGTNQEAAAIGVGNDLFILGANGKNIFGNFDFNAYAANTINFFDLLFFADGAYKLKTSFGDFNFKAQIATANMKQSPNLLLGGNRGVNITSDFHTTLKDQAMFRGIYNLLIGYKYNKFGLKVGYLGSFGDGYGVSLTSKGGIDVGGKMWYSNFTATYEGFGILSSGSKKNTDIQVAYFVTEYSFKKPVKIALDIAYITGNNNFYLTTSSQPINVNLWEITPSIKYNFTKQLEISAQSAFYTGDLDLVKTRMELKYTF